MIYCIHLLFKGGRNAHYNFAEEGKDSRGRIDPTGQTSENQNQRKNISNSGALLVIFIVPPPQGPGVNVKQAKRSSPLCPETGGSTLLGTSKHNSYCAPQRVVGTEEMWSIIKAAKSYCFRP